GVVVGDRVADNTTSAPLALDADLGVVVDVVALDDPRVADEVHARPPVVPDLVAGDVLSIADRIDCAALCGIGVVLDDQYTYGHIRALHVVLERVDRRAASIHDRPRFTDEGVPGLRVDVASPARALMDAGTEIESGACRVLVHQTLDVVAGVDDDGA